MAWSETSTRFSYSVQLSWKPAPTVLPVLIGDNYSLRAVFTPIVEKYLMEFTDDIYRFLLKVEELINDDEVPQEDKNSLKGMLTLLLINQATQIYAELTERELLGSLPYWLWVRFNWDSDWGVTASTFRDMPTELFEKFMTSNDYWDRHNTIDVSEAILYIQERTDLWGGLSKEMLKELLFTPPVSLERKQ